LLQEDALAATGGAKSSSARSWSPRASWFPVPECVSWIASGGGSRERSRAAVKLVSDRRGRACSTRGMHLRACPTATRCRGRSSALAEATAERPSLGGGGQTVPRCFRNAESRGRGCSAVSSKGNARPFETRTHLLPLRHLHPTPGPPSRLSAEGRRHVCRISAISSSPGRLFRPAAPGNANRYPFRLRNWT
jgi:hypothetical protein